MILCDPDDVIVMEFTKGEEHYAFIFKDAYSLNVLRTIGRYASNPDLSLNWQDAKTISRHIVNLSKSTLVDSCKIR